MVHYLLRHADGSHLERQAHIPLQMAVITMVKVNKCTLSVQEFITCTTGVLENYNVTFQSFWLFDTLSSYYELLLVWCIRSIVVVHLHQNFSTLKKNSQILPGL